MLLTVLNAGIFAQKIDQHIEKELTYRNSVPVLVVMRDQADVSLASRLKGKNAKARAVYQILSERAETSQRAISAFLKSQRIPHRSFYLVNALSLEVNHELLDLIKKRDDVLTVIYDQPQPMLELDNPRQDLILPTSRGAEPTWGILNMGVDKLWEKGFKGQGVVIGGQDTGYSWDLDQLKGHYRGSKEDGTVDHNYSWHDAVHQASPLNSNDQNPCGFNLDTPCDDHGHGTHTMGTMTGTDTIYTFGLAPMAQWIGCRNMDRGWGAPSTYIECFEWFLAPTDLEGNNPNPDLAPDVINNSWGCPEEEGCNQENWPLMELAVKNLKAAGTVVVVSAGNDGPSCGSISNPAAIFEASFTIGAYSANNVIAGFSSRGSVSADSSFRAKPNVAAPGVGVLSIDNTGKYAQFSGTSMAGPHAAGLVALIISARPDLRGEVDLIEDIIEQSAIPVNATQTCFDLVADGIPNAQFGFGRVNAENALNAALSTQIDEDSADLEASFFPNTSSGQIYFPESTPDKISIYQSTGQLIFTIQPYSSVITLPDMANGLYYINIQTKGKLVTKPLIYIQ